MQYIRRGDYILEAVSTRFEYLLLFTTATWRRWHLLLGNFSRHRGVATGDIHCIVFLDVVGPVPHRCVRLNDAPRKHLLGCGQPDLLHERGGLVCLVVNTASIREEQVADAMTLHGAQGGLRVWDLLGAGKQYAVAAMGSISCRPQ